MLGIIGEFFKKFTKIQISLMIAEAALVFFLIILSNLDILPIKGYGDFIFFAFLILAFALYRPGWAFLFFVGTIALENISLAPLDLGIAIRPYQFLGALIIAAVLIRLIARRLNFKLEKLRWFDILLILAAVAGLLSALFAPEKTLSLKLSLVFTSYVALYLLIRNYIRDIEDLKKVIPFFLVSAFVVVLYGIQQNIWFRMGLPSFQVMPGRPNATFPEADWLGMFLAFLIPIAFAFIYFIQGLPAEENAKDRWKKLFFPYVFLALTFILLIITVSRSAWIAVFFQTVIFLWFLLTRLIFPVSGWQWRIFAVTAVRISATLAVSVGVVYFFNLTSFQLGNRAQSTGTGLQKITVSCGKNTELPEKVDTSEELIRYGCRHINLEEIKLEEMAGNFIKETYRRDPNVDIRKVIYERSWEEIKKHPIAGIGWGSIGKILGSDERGASLNASNIFLEIWLGSGIFGFLAFLAAWIYILFRATIKLIRTIHLEEKTFAIFVITSWIGLTASNLLNSGIFLGFLWLFLAISLLNNQSIRE